MAPLIAKFNAHVFGVTPTLDALVAVTLTGLPIAAVVGEVKVTSEHEGVGDGVGAGLKVIFRVNGLGQVWLFTFTNETWVCKSPVP